jgi:type I restriction enzyme S subunit
LRSPFTQHALGVAANTTVQTTINLKDLKLLPVPIPPLRVREQITALLAALEDRIELLRQTNSTLESIARALFKSWFIDFCPTHSKAEGREPEGMDAAKAALFPSEFEDSELGLIPKGWRPGTLAELAKLNAESWTAKRRPLRLSYIDLSNVKDNRVDEVTEYEFNDAPSRARRVLRSGDTIVGTVRPGNRSFAYIQNAPDGLTASTGFAVLTANEKWCQEFVYLATTRDGNIARLANLADGGAYPAVRPELVVGTQAVLPTSKVLQAFSAVASPLFDKHAENRRIERSLTEVRDILLPRLISGKLRIPKAQAQGEDALA